MLKLNKIEISGLGPFVTPQTVDFENIGSVCKVNGKNELTGGSSGSGKSSLFMAIDYLFGVNDTPSVALASRKSKDDMYVVGELTWDGRPVTVKRSKKQGLTVVLPDETISGNAVIYLVPNDSTI